MNLYNVNANQESCPQTLYINRCPKFSEQRWNPRLIFYACLFFLPSLPFRPSPLPSPLRVSSPPLLSLSSFIFLSLPSPRPTSYSSLLFLSPFLFLSNPTSTPLPAPSSCLLLWNFLLLYLLSSTYSPPSPSPPPPSQVFFLLLLHRSFISVCLRSLSFVHWRQFVPVKAD